jgi:hypothetical protein
MGEPRGQAMPRQRTRAHMGGRREDARKQGAQERTRAGGARAHMGGRREDAHKQGAQERMQACTATCTLVLN